MKMSSNTQLFQFKQIIYKGKIEDFQVGNFIINCKMHQQPYFYQCNTPECGELICGKIECIDKHFHNNSLCITKIDHNSIFQNLKPFQSALDRLQNYKSAADHIQSQINSNKQKNNNIFQKRKKMNQIYEQLVRQNNSPLDNRFFQKLQQIQIISYQIEAEAKNLSQKIHWDKIWITLSNETQIIHKLKLQFQQFRYLNLIKKQTLYQQFLNRWNVVDKSIFQYEGIISLIFTQENFVIGQFIANSNVQTAKLFLNSFVFIIDQKGKLRKSLISNNLLNMNTITVQNQIVYELAFSQSDLMFQGMEFNVLVKNSLRVSRIQCFFATAY